MDALQGDGVGEALRLILGELLRVDPLLAILRGFISVEHPSSRPPFDQVKSRAYPEQVGVYQNLSFPGIFGLGVVPFAPALSYQRCRKGLGFLPSISYFGPAVPVSARNFFIAT